MLPIYFVVGLINIFSQHHNYGIDIKDPEFDIRVRRSICEDPKQEVFHFHKNKETNLNREKRYAYYDKIRISNNDVTQRNNGSQSTRNNGNRYDIFNPNWNFLFNATKTSHNSDNSILNQPINRRPIINSYPYGYPSGYRPKTSTATRIDRVTTTAGYSNQDSNTPYFYNYQNPDGRNFAGFVGASNITGPYGSRYTTRANNYALSPYPPNNSQKPLTNISIKNLPTSYSTTNNSGVPNWRYATNPVNGISHNNNFNSTPKPFVKDIFSPYSNFNNGSFNIENGSAAFNNGLADWNKGTPNFDNGSAYFNNASVDFNNVSLNFENGSVNINNASVNFNNASSNLNNGTVNFDNGFPNINNRSFISVNSTNTTVTTTEKIVSGCVICNIPCPKFMRRFGRFCMPVDADNDY